VDKGNFLSETSNLDPLLEDQLRWRALRDRLRLLRELLERA